MRKISQWLKRAGSDRHAAGASVGLERALSEAELHCVAGGGGKSTTSSNPVEDRAAR